MDSSSPVKTEDGQTDGREGELDTVFLLLVNALYPVTCSLRLSSEGCYFLCECWILSLMFWSVSELDSSWVWTLQDLKKKIDEGKRPNWFRTCWGLTYSCIFINECSDSENVIQMLERLHCVTVCGGSSFYTTFKSVVDWSFHPAENVKLSWTSCFSSGQSC